MVTSIDISSDSEGILVFTITETSDDGKIGE